MTRPFRRRHILPALCIAALSLPVQADEVVVFAAASLKGALDEVAADFSRRTGHHVTLSYAGSGQLARQIIAGAPADLFLSANPEWMNSVQSEGLIADGTRRDLLGNRLVLIAHGPDAPTIQIGPDIDFMELLMGGKLAMALVDAVPAGQYGKAALQSLGHWDRIRADVAQTDNVRAALALVSTGEAPYGITYATDAVADSSVSVAGVFPESSHPPIIYPAALLTGANDPTGRDFLDGLTAPGGKIVFERHGFAVLD